MDRFLNDPLVHLSLSRGMAGLVGIGLTTLTLLVSRWTLSGLIRWSRDREDHRRRLVHEEETQTQLARERLTDGEQGRLTALISQLTGRATPEVRWPPKPGDKVRILSLPSPNFTYGHGGPPLQIGDICIIDEARNDTFCGVSLVGVVSSNANNNEPTLKLSRVYPA